MTLAFIVIFLINVERESTYDFIVDQLGRLIFKEFRYGC